MLQGLLGDEINNHNDHLECLKTLHKILGNIIQNPNDQTKRTIKKENKQFNQKVGRFLNAIQILFLVD